MRFKSIEFKGNKIFRDGKIVFNKGLTVIVGSGGTGKTILFNMLKIAMGVEPVGYRLSVSGKLNKEYFELMFVDEWFLDRFRENQGLADWSEQHFERLFKICDKHLGKFFPKMINGYKVYSPKNWNLQRSEMFIGDFATLLALRQSLRVKDPLVLDCAFNRFDEKIRQQLYQVLKKLPYQVILFEHSHKNPDYRLVYDSKTGKSSIVKLSSR